MRFIHTQSNFFFAVVFIADDLQRCMDTRIAELEPGASQSLDGRALAGKPPVATEECSARALSFPRHFFQVVDDAPALRRFRRLDIDHIRLALLGI